MTNEEKRRKDEWGASSYKEGKPALVGNNAITRKREFLTTNSERLDISNIYFATARPGGVNVNGSAR